MKENKTEIVVLLDRSGSMSSILTPMERALNSFIKEQKQVEGECVFSLIQFDNLYNVVIEPTDIQDVQDINFEPRGMTALNDAGCRCIDETGNRLALMKEEDRPEKVLIVIITDGLENASRNFSTKDLADRIKHQQEKYNWDFIYLGANQDAITTASWYGISGLASMTYDTSDKGVFSAVSGSLSSTVKAYRVGSKADLSFSEEDRQKQKDFGVQ